MLLCIASFILSLLSLQDQSNPRNQELGSIQGKVLDTMGRPLKKAVVRIFMDGQLFRETNADEVSNYEFPALRPGSYVIRVARKSGLGNAKSFDREVFLLRNQKINLDLIALNIPDHFPPLQSRVEGTVSDGKSPLKGARVRLVNPFYLNVLKEVMTGEEGEYSIDLDVQGQYLIQVLRPGSLVASIIISATGEKYVRNFILGNLQ